MRAEDEIPQSGGQSGIGATERVSIFRTGLVFRASGSPCKVS